MPGTFRGPGPNLVLVLWLNLVDPGRLPTTAKLVWLGVLESITGYRRSAEHIGNEVGNALALEAACCTFILSAVEGSLFLCLLADVRKAERSFDCAQDDNVEAGLAMISIGGSGRQEKTQLTQYSRANESLT